MNSDDLQLVELEVAKVIDLSREQALRKAGSTAAPTLDLSPQLQELLQIGPGDSIPGVADLEALQKMLAAVKATAPAAYLTMPGVPPEKLKLEVVQWLRREIHPLTLVTFEYNRGLAGGFALRLGSQVYDYSFRHALLGNSQAMVKVMKHV